jgi:hypothetical protein
MNFGFCYMPPIILLNVLDSLSLPLLTTAYPRIIWRLFIIDKGHKFDIIHPVVLEL